MTHFLCRIRAHCAQAFVRWAFRLHAKAANKEVIRHSLDFIEFRKQQSLRRQLRRAARCHQD